MVEFPASSLTAGDEFTVNDGETWHIAKVIREANRGTRIVVITREDREVILKSNDQVVVK